MKMEDMILISVDDHIVEPPDAFKHVSAKYRDYAPRIVTADDGSERWLFHGKMMAPVGAAAVAGRSREERHLEPAKYDQLRKGCYDVHARIDDMNANGVLTSLNFGTLTGFAGELFLQGDKDINLACLKAFNDWHIDDWCGAYPGRFIPVAQMPLWDVDEAVKETKRVAGKGAKAIVFPENPDKLGLPTIHTGAWDPLWKTCIDQNLAVCIHIGTGGGFRFPSMDSPADVAITTMNITLADCTADILFSEVLRKFPELRIALSEGYMGWIPFFKERADYVYKFHRFWTGQDFGNKKPSDLVREHFLFCFTDDPTGVKNRHDIGIETITWECDYPHADSTWPESPEWVWRNFEKADVPDDEINQMTHLNAMRFFNIDPFKYMAKEECTVAALRQKAKEANVDTRPIKGKGGYQPFPKGKVITAQDLADMAKEMGNALLKNDPGAPVKADASSQ